MTKWVGIVASLMLTLSLLGTGATAPHPDLKIEQFADGGSQDWLTVSGTSAFVEDYGLAGDRLTWMVVADDDDASGVGPSRVIADPAGINGTMTSYMIHAILERDHTYVAPGDAAPAPRAVGITFGETPGSGHYTVAFRDDFFALAVPDAATGGTTLFHSQNDWGTVPSYINDVDDRHRYSVLIDGTTLTVLIDGFELGSFTLPGVPAGTYGIIAGDDTRVYSEQIVYGPLDTNGPSIQLERPADASMYLMDQEMPIPATGLTVAAGTLTVAANITDDVIGTKVAWLKIDGVLQKGSARVDPGADANWTVDLSMLSTGIHTISVEARDWANNLAVNETKVVVIGGGAPDGATVDLAGFVAGEALSLVPA